VDDGVDVIECGQMVPIALCFSFDFHTVGNVASFRDEVGDLAIIVGHWPNGEVDNSGPISALCFELLPDKLAVTGAFDPLL